MKERSNQINKQYLPQEAGLPPECQIIINDVFVIQSRDTVAFSLTSNAKEGVNSSVKCFFQHRVKDLSLERGCSLGMVVPIFSFQISMKNCAKRRSVYVPNTT